MTVRSELRKFRARYHPDKNRELRKFFTELSKVISQQADLHRTGQDMNN